MSLKVCIKVPQSITSAKTNNDIVTSFSPRREFTFTPLKAGSPYCPVTLGFLHLARRGVFVETPSVAWAEHKFTIKEESKSWPLLCQVDCSTQTLTVSIRLSATSIKIKIGNQNI